MMDTYADVIVLLQNTIINKIKEKNIAGAIYLLRSQEIQDILSNPGLSIECEDFMYEYVLGLRDEIEESKKKNQDMFNIDVYNKYVQVYDDYSEICKVFFLGQSSTILAGIYSILKAWKAVLMGGIFEPQPPAFRGLIDDDSLPF